ncbi:hypothetical protein HPB49_005726 [Dermacentor silvarum]|uniref:Uncharacterized protein n=1 Tax=Dermacentor silvarum TaxID=543639 RepID=A0ACB8CQ23_DERSI|nr:hypothetical protein HPB49_005726 [Dermacentor silvarum]
MTANRGQADGWLSERRYALLLEPTWVAEHEAESLRAGLERVVGRRAPCGRRCWQRCHSGGGRTAKAVLPLPVTSRHCTSEQVSRMIRRVSSKRGGLRGRHSLRLAQAFVTSRVLYPTPYLCLPHHHENQLDTLLRSIHKRALDLPIATYHRFAALGVHNSYDELREAHSVNQVNRLSQTTPGRRLLDSLSLNPISTPLPPASLTVLWRHQT